MNKNVCIIHYNTPTLTEKLVESINKHVQDTKIFIFDNSDKRPFRKEYDNVTILDNTKKQYIDFDKWLKKYPNRNLSGGKANKWGSAKHAYSVEKCMELIKEPFVLLDSDVLIKKDFSSIYYEDVCYVGEIANQPKSRIKRVLPFICFINTPLCLEKKIHYFDEKYMHGLRVGPTGDRYDTGAAIFLLTEKFKGKHKEIKVADYVVHYGSGSWVAAQEKMKRKTHVPENEWLKKNEKLWKKDVVEPKTENKFETVFDHIYCLHNLSDADRLPLIKEELKRVGIDENACYFSWKYDFPSDTLDCIYDDKRLNLDAALRSTARKYIKKVSMRHYEIIKEAYTLGYERILILEDDIRFHKDLDYVQKMLANIPDSDIVLFDKMTSSSFKENLKYKELVRSLDKDTLYGNMDGIFFIFCSCYALTRTGMEHIIKRQEEKLLPPDTPFNDPGINGSFAVVNLAIQDPKFKTRKVETYDKISLDTTMYGPENTEVALVTKPKAVEKQTEKKVTGRTISQPSKIRVISVPPKKKETVKPRTLDQVRRITSKKTLLPDKAIRTRSRTIQPNAVGHNKLYDVY